jgi:hypothetical protein
MTWFAFAPQLGDSWFRAIERSAARFAARKHAVVVGVALAAILARLALLPILPVPVPDAHDEFSYLLAGDTFAHARLTNPPHPMWIFLDTFHVLQHPTYMSIFQPAQGAVLAIGQILGHPWIGVLLSMAAMCAAIAWMLQGWLPDEWALLGSVLVVLRIDLFSYWTDSYWGGAVAATGGALVVGALPRIIRHQRSRHAWLMGLGAGLLANSRPVEGFIFCVPVALAMVVWLLRPTRPEMKITGSQVVIPLICVLMLTVAFIGYYNWRVTGNALLLPHALYQRQYTNFPLLVWQSPDPPLKYSNPQFDDYFNTWQHSEYHRSWLDFLRISRSKCFDLWQFYLGAVLWIPFLALPWVLGDHRTRFLLLQLVLCVLGILAVIWIQPHYAAPLTASIFALLVQSMRHLRRWEFKGRPLGIFVTRLVVLLVLSRVLLYIWRPPSMHEPWSWSRSQIVKQLAATPERHLVLVSYSPVHNEHQEWVYNEADVDSSKVVWAREIPGRSLQPLLSYFRGRKIWVCEPDTVPVRIYLYDGTAFAGEAPAPSE